MENTQDTQNMELTLAQVQHNFQVNFNIMQVKLQLINIAKELFLTRPTEYENITDTYLDLREEVLGIPNPKKDK